MKYETTEKAIGWMGCVIMIVWLTVVSVLVWAAIHFIRKFW